MSNSTEFALFGSVLRDDFRPDSDIDVMVQFHPEAHPTFGSLDQMEAELKTMFYREVDLITRDGIEHSRNYLRRREILSSAHSTALGDCRRCQPQHRLGCGSKGEGIRVFAPFSLGRRVGDEGKSSQRKQCRLGVTPARSAVSLVYRTPHAQR